MARSINKSIFIDIWGYPNQGIPIFFMIDTELSSVGLLSRCAWLDLLWRGC